jgi:LysR family nitrogen assimilation transcriptional regulator
MGSVGMDLRQLRYFVAIVDCNSLSSASMQLRVAQPALSQHIRHMEEELGLALLDRTTRGVTPTEAGRRLYASARTVLSQMVDLPDFVRGADTNPTGDVRFGMSGTVSELVGVPLLEEGKSRYPGIRIRIVEAMSGHILEWVRRGEIDAALIYATSSPKGVEITHVLTEDLCLFGRPNPILPPSGTTVEFVKIACLELIINGPSHGLRELIDEAAASIPVPLNPIFEVDSYSHIKRLVSKGKGYAILPQTAIAAEVNAGIFDFWKIKAPRLRRNIYLVTSTERTLSAAGKVISALSREITERLVREGAWLADVATPV